MKQSLPQSIPLPGGVSCEVVIERDAAGHEVVVKEPLAKLKVTADWRSNPERFLVEVRALRALRDLLSPGSVPEVVWVDEARHRFAMERIDPRLRNWKIDLLNGNVDLTTAARVGELLGAMHRRSAASEVIRKDFANRTYFEELRIEPFFERVAKRNLGVAPSIERAIADLRAPGLALVHGDFSPKNILADGAHVVILDLEIAHWGNPRFDVAFCLSHLGLKARRKRVDPQPYFESARQFMAAYRSNGLAVLDGECVRILGALLLARFDGASPVDYLAQLDEPRVRACATEFLQAPDATVDAALEKLFARN